MKTVCEWGLKGLETYRDDADVFVVVDVLSFSTCVDVACTRGAKVYPFVMSGREAGEVEADRLGAVLAGKRSDPDARFSLSPQTLVKIPSGTRLLLPSPNGSTISFAAQGKPVLAGCFRNAQAVASVVASLAQGGTVAVIPAGERWPDGSLRPAIEDLLGAGAVLAALGGHASPEAAVAREAYLSAEKTLPELIRGSLSGQELIARGFPGDVEIALEVNASNSAPLLYEGAFQTYLSG